MNRTDRLVNTLTTLEQVALDAFKATLPEPMEYSMGDENWNWADDYHDSNMRMVAIDDAIARIIAERTVGKYDHLDA